MTLPVLAFLLATSAWAQFSSSDLYKLRSVTEVELSPDAAHVAYAVSNNDGEGRPYAQLHVRNISSGRTVALAKAKDPSGGAVWSRDGSRLAYSGKLDGKSGLIVSRPDGSGARWIAALEGTNHPLLNTGRKIAWSPDGKRLAYITAVPGPETQAASGDPMVITRYIYKPDDAEGLSHFNDNRRTHIFLADLESGQTRPLTTGNFYEHSIDWAPSGDEILFVSHREPTEDVYFNHDVFTVNAATAGIRRVTATENAEYQPRWAPDGASIAYLATRRGITDLETTMEDTHVWLMNADGTGRREIGTIDNRQSAPQWSSDGKSIWFTAQERGSVRLMRVPAAGGSAETAVGERGTTGPWSIARNHLAYAFSTVSDLPQLHLKSGGDPARPITKLNDEILAGRKIAEVESFTFVSNDNRWDVEAFLTKPPGLDPSKKYPLIVVIHGGPHAQQGPAFNFKNQVYASRGWATLMVNYRGSTGYGQKFADGVFGDQNGNEAQDVLYGISAALRRYLWIDRDRLGVEGGSYGGQLSAWLVTQTNIFKAAIPLAPIINLVSYNYMTYYNMYEQMTFGILPHQGDLMDEMWRRSSLRYVARVKTPVMLLHGEHDADVPIAESEQFYIGLKDAGVEAVMVRYPREGHGLREPKHIVDSIDRSIQWYRKHFPK